MTQPAHADQTATTTPADAAGRLTSEEARQMYLDQLKKTNPDPKVRAVIDALETGTPRPRRRTRKGRHRRAAPLADRSGSNGVEQACG